MDFFNLVRGIFLGPKCSVRRKRLRTPDLKKQIKAVETTKVLITWNHVKNIELDKTWKTKFK